MSKHTPGPWVVKDCGTAEDVRLIRSGGVDVIATVHAGFTDNARLIAAAPELLATVEGLLKTFHDCREFIAADMVQEQPYPVTDSIRELAKPVIEARELLARINER